MAPNSKVIIAGASERRAVAFVEKWKHVVTAVYGRNAVAGTSRNTNEELERLKRADMYVCEYGLLDALQRHKGWPKVTERVSLIIFDDIEHLGTAGGAGCRMVDLVVAVALP